MTEQTFNSHIEATVYISHFGCHKLLVITYQCSCWLWLLYVNVKTLRAYSGIKVYKVYRRAIIMVILLLQQFAIMLIVWSVSVLQWCYEIWLHVNCSYCKESIRVSEEADSVRTEAHNWCCAGHWNQGWICVTASSFHSFFCSCEFIVFLLVDIFSICLLFNFVPCNGCSLTTIQ